MSETNLSGGEDSVVYLNATLVSCVEQSEPVTRVHFLFISIYIEICGETLFFRHLSYVGGCSIESSSLWCHGRSLSVS